jgi:hypothetical protein
MRYEIGGARPRSVLIFKRAGPNSIVQPTMSPGLEGMFQELGWLLQLDPTLAQMVLLGKTGLDPSRAVVSPRSPAGPS